MSWKGNLIKAGISSDGKSVDIFRGNLTVYGNITLTGGGEFVGAIGGDQERSGTMTMTATDTALIISGAAALGISMTGSWTTAAIQIGSSTTAIVMAAYNDYAIDINTTCAVASNSGTPINAFHLKSTTTGYASEDWTMAVESYTTVYAGNENTVGHFYSNWVGTGIGPLGMCSSVTAKMLLPTSCTGAFFPFYGKINFPATPYAGINNAGASCGWFMLSIGGDSGGYSNFDDYGLFMEIHNISAGSGNLLSETSQTLRCAIPSAGATKYLMLSKMEDGLGFGTSSVDMALGTSITKRAVELYTSSTSVDADDSIRYLYARHTVLASGGVGHRAEFCTRTEFALGSWANALKGYMDFGDAGYCTGMASGVCAELRLPDMEARGGALFPLEVEIVAQDSSAIVGSFGNMAGFIYLGATQSSGTPFDEDGRFMMIKGLTPLAGSILSADSQTLRVALNPSSTTLTERYMVLSDTENCLDFAGGTARGTAIEIGSTTTGIQVDDDPDYVAEIYGSIATGTQTLTGNNGTLNCRLTVAANSTIVSNSFNTAGYFRYEMAGACTLSGWNTAILGYTKTATTGAVGASASITAAIVGLVNFQSGYIDEAGWTAAFIAGTYGPTQSTITDFTGFLVFDNAMDNFDNGFMCANDAATVAYKAGDCTTGIWLEGDMTDGIEISGAMGDCGIEISGTCTDSCIQMLTGTSAYGIYMSQAFTAAAICVATNTVIDQFLVIGDATDPIHWDGAAENWLVHTECTDTTNASKTAYKFVLDAPHGGAFTSGRLECFRGEVKSYSTDDITGSVRAVVGQISFAAGCTYTSTGSPQGCIPVVSSLFAAGTFTGTGDVFGLGVFWNLGNSSSVAGESSMLYMYIAGQTAPSSYMCLWNGCPAGGLVYLIDFQGASLNTTPIVSTGLTISEGDTPFIKIRVGEDNYGIPIVSVT